MKGKRKTAAIKTEAYGPPIDFTFHQLSSVDELVHEQPSGGVVKHGESRNAKLRLRANSNALKIANNNFTSLRGLSDVAQTFFDDCTLVCWLDASCNRLHRIDEDIADAFPNLRVLYLHGNLISSLEEVQKLKRLPSLERLTLHGNPMEERHKRYRIRVLNALPQLKSHDFIGRSRRDFERLATWREEQRIAQARRKRERQLQQEMYE